MTRTVLAALLALGMAHSAAAQAVVGGSAETDLGVLVSPSDPAASALQGSLVFRPTLHAATDVLEVSVQASIDVDLAGLGTSFTLDALEVDATPWEFLKLSAGRMNYVTGAVSLLSPVSWWTRIDWDSLISGRLADILVPADLLQVRLLWGDAALVLAVDPFPRRATFPSTDSAWFPGKDIPPSIPIGFPVNQTLVLESVTMEDPALPAAQPQTMSASAEATATVGPVDASLLYYHGYDMSPLVQARLDFPYGLYKAFDVILTPVDRVIDACGLSATASVSELRICGDLAWTLAKTFSTERLSASTFQTVLAVAPYLEYALEATWEHPQPHLTVSCEWKGSWIPTPPAGVVMPLLSSVLVGTTSVRLLDEKLSLGTSTIISLQDNSAAILADVSFNPSSEITVQVGAPFFFGAATTELGEFAANHLVTLTSVWRF
ncbi:MAG TPA: hypothetical protein VMM82_06845 [Spirochaetia bacterium]|nr:hypothetical protein [Spirochaetia bacterium]